IVEQMGNEEFIHFSIGKTQYSSRVAVENSCNLQFGNISEFYFDMDKCHIFDFETEENVSLIN
ncbi:MAG: sugar ABC transporter ATP-binding protein, partial [Cetobacterium sp.]